MAKVRRKCLESLLKAYPHIKISKDKYLVFEKPSRIPAILLEYIEDIGNYLLKMIVIPFLIVGVIFKIIGTFLPRCVKGIDNSLVVKGKPIKELATDELHFNNQGDCF